MQEICTQTVQEMSWSGCCGYHSIPYSGPSYSFPQIPGTMAAHSSVPSLTSSSMEESDLTLGHAPSKGTAHIQGAQCNQVATSSKLNDTLTVSFDRISLSLGFKTSRSICPPLQRQKTLSSPSGSTRITQAHSNFNFVSWAQVFYLLVCNTI